MDVETCVYNLSINRNDDMRLMRCLLLGDTFSKISKLVENKTIQIRFRNCISFIWFKNMLVKYIIIL